MKRSQYTSKTAECPFYKKEEQHKIYCNGIVENSSVHLAFGKDSDCKEYKQTKCRDDYLTCPVHKMLEVLLK